MSMKIGFIGLGNMGAPMATNLAKAGHDVAGFDVAGTTAEGVRVADSLEAAVAGMDAVITMLPNGSILRQVAAQAIPPYGARHAVHRLFHRGCGKREEHRASR